MADEKQPDGGKGISWFAVNTIFNTFLLSCLVLGSTFGGCSSKPDPKPIPPDDGSKVADIKLPFEIKGDPAVMIDVPATTVGTLVKWYVDPRLSWKVIDSKNIAVVAKDKGKYFVVGWTAIKGVPTDPAIAQILVGDSEPLPPIPVPPGPTPVPPGPTPTPTPVKQLFAVIIEDTSQSTPDRSAYYGNVELVKYFRSKGYVLRVEDKNVIDKDGKPPKDLQSYLNVASGKPLPYLFLVNEGGKELFKGSRPATPQALLDLVKKVGG